MPDDYVLQFLLVAFLLVAVLLALVVRRITQEGITLQAAPRGHFKRSPEEVRRQIEMQRATMGGATGSTPASDPVRRFAYGFGRRVGYDFAASRAAVERALADEGFGVLTEIDVAATLKKKLDRDMPPYVILGACNPKLAGRALEAEPRLGLLLPCNVVVREDDDGEVFIECMDPEAVLSLVDNPQIAEVAADVRARLERMLASLGGAAESVEKG